MRLSQVMTIALMLLTIAGCAGATQAQERSLYQRLGGYDAIAAVNDEFIRRLITGQQFTRFFAGFSTDSKKRIRQHVVDQLCQATGGPCFYTGRDMKVVHTGLGITDRDWDGAVKQLTAAFGKFSVPERE